MKVNIEDLDRIHAFCVGAYHRAAGNAVIEEEARYCVRVIENVLGTPASLSAVIEESRPLDEIVELDEDEGYDVFEVVGQGAEEVE